MMKKLLAGVAALFCMTQTAEAQMVTASNPQSIARSMQDAGYVAELTTEQGGEDPLIRSASSGSRFSVYFYGCTKGRDCNSIQFYAGYTGHAASAERINEWNSHKRFARAYRDDDDAVRIEMDLNLDKGGISKALFLDNLLVWTQLMASFEKHINE